jgi:plasmid maintenance system antidote protein VapI
MTMTTTEKALPVATALGAIIHQLMWQQQITQTAMAAALGIQGPTMGKKLRGRVTITVDELATIARVLGEDAGDLMLRACRDSNPKPSDP